MSDRWPRAVGRLCARVRRPRSLGGRRQGSLGRMLARTLAALRPSSVTAGRALGGVAVDQAAVGRDQSDRYEPGLRAERQGLLEGLGERSLVASAKAGDRGVVWDLVSAQDAEGDVPSTPSDARRRELLRARTMPQRRAR